MTDKPARPTFDDKNETEAPTPAAPEMAPPTPQGDGDPGVAPSPAMTAEESAVAAKAMFEPTLRRMAVLIDTLIHISENGDFALWAPLGAMDMTLRGLDWRTADRVRVEKFYCLLSQTLSHYAARLDGFRLALNAMAPDAPLPPIPEWTTDDTLEMYDIVDKLYPATGGDA